jgi:LCP family protein required for cell wall assembly
VLIGFNVAMVALTLTLALVLAYANDKLEEVVRIDDLPLEPVGGEEGEEADPGAPQNYLLVGTDSAARLDEDDPASREDQGLLSDTIMVLRVDPDQTQAQLLSFPRDLWVDIPGWGEQKINAALAGGRETLIATITENFGIPINHYVEIDFLGFQELVEAVDGVPIYLDKPLRDSQTGLYQPRAGCVTLDPDQALAYARSRHLEYLEDDLWQTDGTGDLGRIARQQDFIRRAIQRAIDKGVRNPITLNSLVNAGVESVAIDDGLTVDDLIDLGRRFRSFDPDQLHTMALDISFDFVGDVSVLYLQDTEANEARLNIFRGVGQPGTGGAADAAAVGVSVLNGTGITGQATETSASLAALGFDTTPGTGDAERFDIPRTVVRYVPGNEAAAQLVAAQLQAGAQLEQVTDTGGADVVLVTGLDHAGVKPALAAPPTTTTPTPPPSTSSTTLPDLPTTTVLGEVPTAPAGQTC